MKILIVSSYLPFPLFDGGSIRLYNLIKELHKEHEITLICEKRPHQTTQDIEEIEKISKKVVTVPRKKQWSLSNIVKTCASKDSFLITGHKLPEMKALIEQELRNENYDVIHVETSYVMQNIPETKIPIVLVEHNIEYMVYEKFMNKAPLPLRPFLKIDIAKLRKIEETFWAKATQVVAVSDLEKAVIDKTGVKAKTVYNGVDLKSFSLKDVSKTLKESPKQFLFIGNYKWLQNRDSARWILNEVWPLIKQKCKEEVTLRVVGRDMPDDIKNWSDESVIVEENSSRKTAEIFSESFALLAPIRIGGGSQYKILEAMAVGTPTITTSLGLSGLDITKDKDTLVGDTAESLSEKALDLVSNTNLYKSLAQNGRRQIEEKYDWAIIAKTLEEVYKSVITK
jgi:glycosyltransferase involved in cell wall biosynthesis